MRLDSPRRKLTRLPVVKPVGQNWPMSGTSRPVRRSSLVAIGSTCARYPLCSSTAWRMRSARQCRPPNRIVTESRSPRVKGRGVYARYGSAMTVAIPSSVGMSIHPGFEKLDGGESGQASDRLVDLPNCDPPVLALEEVLRHELELTRHADPAADRSPEMVHEEACDPGRGRAPQALLGLTVIEEEVARFIAHDPLEQLVEDGVPGNRREPQISG